MEEVTAEASKYTQMASDIIMTWGPKVIAAIVTLLIGLWIIGIITRGIAKTMQKRDVDPSLRPFLKSLISAVLKVMLFISVIGMVGIEATSFVAVLGAAGLAIGLALQGTLQNFAGGVIILLIKPFKVGDWVDTPNHSGTVHAIQIFHTILKTPDNKTIIIPNGPLANSSLTNYSTEPRRRLDLTVGVGYGDSTEKTRETLMELINADDRILKDPEPFIAVAELADSSVNFTVRLWVEAGDYWPLKFDMNERIYNKFNEVGLNIPFPQMDVHVHKNN
ncbi:MULTISPECIES: mechanosensitive ion channel domain-containing protein [unclassified Ekhidna]|jgi:small conductance mechanosensitive channel|uniref:mechanosensitive ion channel family protein n=1 Tax=unclassified Ekhidna TaxID=2632188 RepID=UPI0032DF8A54